jgi:hypothetical protein
MRYTTTTLKKLEELFTELEYTIRYEKGNFQSGYCLVENRRIAVVNKFFDTEARINCLVEILSTLDIDSTTLTEEKRATFDKWRKHRETVNTADPS